MSKPNSVCGTCIHVVAFVTFIEFTHYKCYYYKLSLNAIQDSFFFFFFPLVTTVKDKSSLPVCVIYLSEGIVPTQWDAIFDIKTKQLRNSLGFNISVFIVYVSNG